MDKTIFGRIDRKTVVLKLLNELLSCSHCIIIYEGDFTK